MLKNFKRITHSCLEVHKALKDECDLVSEGQGEGTSPGRRAHRMDMEGTWNDPENKKCWYGFPKVGRVS